MNFEQSDPRIPRIIARLRRVQQQREKRIALLATALWLTDIEQASPLERPHIVFTLSPSYTGWASGSFLHEEPSAPSELGSSIWRCERAMFESSWKAEKLTEALGKQVCADVAAEVERRIEESVKPDRQIDIRNRWAIGAIVVYLNDNDLADGVLAEIYTDGTADVRDRVTGALHENVTIVPYSSARAIAFRQREPK